jgi:hypothetical protein
MIVEFQRMSRSKAAAKFDTWLAVANKSLVRFFPDRAERGIAAV